MKLVTLVNSIVRLVNYLIDFELTCKTKSLVKLEIGLYDL